MTRTAFTTAERKAVRERTKGKCAKCLVGAIDQIHHIRAVMDGGTNDLDNLVGICGACHSEWHVLMDGRLPFETWLQYPPAHILIGALVLCKDRPDNADPLDVDAFLIQVRQAMYAESARRPIDST